MIAAIVLLSLFLVVSWIQSNKQQEEIDRLEQNRRRVELENQELKEILKFFEDESERVFDSAVGEKSPLKLLKGGLK